MFYSTKEGTSTKTSLTNCLCHQTLFCFLQSGGEFYSILILTLIKLLLF